MAYGLRYYKELTHPDGKVVRLEILQKGYTGNAKEIGPVCQALRLDIQGDNEIDAPIVKTSLSMTFVDAPDHSDANTKKCGNWAEFYTSDATLWQVVLKARKAEETAFTAIWGGYITPDSYTEVLQYRGSVTLIARDNIGHMQDFPFDAEGDADGMISLQELVETAWSKIESPMVLNWHGNARWLYTEGQSARATYMNVSAFKDGNWFDAVESALYGYGLALRYTGMNEVSIYSLRELPLMGKDSASLVTSKEPVFMAGAERELTPAAKRIEERVSYDLVSTLTQPQVKEDDFSGEVDEYNNIIPQGSSQSYTLYAWHILNTEGSGWRDSDAPIYFNPSAYAKDSTVDDRELDFMWLASSDYIGSDSMYSPFFKSIIASNIGIEFRTGHVYYLNSNVLTRFGSGMYAKTISVSVSASQNGVTQYLNSEGEWQTSLVKISLSVDESGLSLLNVPAGTFSGIISLEVRIYRTISGRTTDAYVPLYSMTFSEQRPLLETNNVNTIYEEKNNVILSREPKIGPAMDNSFLAGIIKNGIFYKSGGMYLPAKAWYWAGNTPQQMAVYNHLQLLCYHAKPNNILRGTLVNADVTDMAVTWMWQGAEHMLVSGSLNFISGHIDNAVLREFSRYENMWGDLPESDYPETASDSSTNVEGASSGTSGATVENTTTVNIGGSGTIELDTYMSDTSENGVMNRVIKAYVDDLEGDITEAYEGAISALDTKIQTALSGKTDKATTDALAQRVTAEEDVTAEYEEWWSALKAKVVVENGDVKISTNLIVTGDTSSGGEGGDTPAEGTVTGIHVNGVTYEPTAGIVTIPDYPTNLDWESISGKPSFATVATSGSYTDLSNKPTIASLMGSSSIGGTSAFLYWTGSAWATKSLGDRAFDSTSYLPLSGGTMTGALKLGSKGELWYGSNGEPYFKNLTNGNYINIGGDTLYWNNQQKILHLGNYATQIGDYYIKSSGGTISGSGAELLKIDSSNASYNVILFKSNGVSKSEFGYAPDGYSYIFDYSSSKYLGIDSSGTPFFGANAGSGKYTLIHSGNIGSQQVSSVFTGSISDGNTAQYTDKALRWFSGIPRDTANLPDFSGYQNGLLALSLHTGGATAQLYFHAANGLFYRGNTAADWKTIAFTDSNVASAQALTHSNGKVAATVTSGGALELGNLVWLQATNAAGSGNIPMLIANTNDQLVVGYGKNDNIFRGKTHLFSLGTSETQAMLINSSGNVTIGASDLAGTGAKLYVDGHFHMPYLVFYNNDIYSKTNGLWLQPNGVGDVNINYLGTNTIINQRSGNVLIGTTTDNGAKLQLAGHIAPTTSGSYTLGTNTYQWDAVYSMYHLAKSGSKLILGANNSSHITIETSGAVTMSSTLDVTSHITTSNRVYAPYIFIGKNAEGIYLGNEGIYWHTNSNAWASTLLTFASKEITAHVPVTMSSTLSVTGNITCSANIIASGDTSSGSDIRFKDRIEDMAISISDIANAPLFTFKWNDREDDTIHLGSSAQYWERITPQLVSGQDFKSLNYATLGVAMGISLAKKSINHEERIKALEKENNELREKIRRIEYGC